MILVEMEQKISSEDDDNGGNVEQLLSFFRAMPLQYHTKQTKVN